MKKHNPEIERYRVTEKKAKLRRVNPRLASDSSLGSTGLFHVPYKNRRGVRVMLNVIAANGAGWDHVSVSVFRKKRTPTWSEMNYIKDLFFEEEETVIQYHPPHSQYMNDAEYCLHLWRPHEFFVPTPPAIMVGIKPKYPEKHTAANNGQ